MKKFKILASVLVVLFILVEVFTLNQNKEEAVDKKPLVTVSSFFLYDITEHIAKNDVEIINILPFGVDPHSFEMTPSIMSKIEKSSLVFYSGAGLEPWVDKMTFKSKSIDMSTHMKLRHLSSGEGKSHQHHHEDEHTVHNTLDPHYWLDFDNMKNATDVVTQELISLLPKNREIYLQHRDIYLKMLQKLDENYSKKLKTCKVHHLILNHNSMGYLADRYNFHSESLSGLSPDAQPTPYDIKRILHEIEENSVNTIFFENFVNAKVIKTIARDTGIKVEVIESLGNITADEAKLHLSYEDLMYKNLEKLSKALKCN